MEIFLGWSSWKLSMDSQKCGMCMKWKNSLLIALCRLYRREGTVTWVSLLITCTGQENKFKHFMLLHCFPTGFLTLVSHPLGCCSQCRLQKKMAQRCCDTSSLACWVAGRLKICMVKLLSCTLFIGLVFPHVVWKMLLNIYHCISLKYY